MPIQVPFDLTADGRFCAGELTWEGDCLSLAIDGQALAAYSLHEASELKQRTDIGCGRLELCQKQGTGPADDIPLCRFSMSYVDEIGEFCKAVNYYLEHGVVLQPRQDERRRCPKCGRAMLPGINTCFFCTDRRLLWRRAWGLFGELRPKLIAATILMIIFNGLNVMVPLLNRWVVDHVLAPTGAAALPFGMDKRGALLLVGGAIAGCYCAAQLFLGVSNRMMRRSGSQFADRLRCLLYDKVQNLSVSSIQKRTAGDLMKRVTQDTQQVREFVVGMGRACIEKAVMLLAVACILLATNWKLALCVVVPVPLTLLLFRRFWARVSVIYEKQWVCASRERAVLRDIIKGIRVVKTFGMEDREIEKYSKVAKRFADISTRNERVWALLYPIPRMAMYFGEVLMILLGGAMVLRGKMSVGTLVQFTLFAAYLNEPLRWMARFPRELAEANVSLMKMFEILDETPSVPESREPVTAEIDGAIAFEGVQFGYKAYEPVLKDVTLSVKPNEMIGLVGHSGAGKSTMINLILRLYDVDIGTLKIGGRDIRDYDYAYLRQNIGVVFQETFLFSGTVYDNIAYAKPGAAPEEVFRAARMANAHAFIMQLADGYNTFIGEDGHNLSGGERQRVAIARAVLKDPKILILDEATSALDPETEQQIQQALERLVKGRTTIAIAHRLSTLRHANRLAVIEQGKLAELGSHRELLGQRGIYYDLVMAQRMMAARR